MNGNAITVVGNLTRDPELRFTAGGQAMAKWSVADNYGWKNKAGEWETKTSFVDCVVWGPIAEHVAESLTKGDRVIVVGRIDQSSWETEEGERRHRLEVSVDSVGPDLRFATATVAKAAQEDGSPKRASGGSGGSKRGNARPEPEYDENEEPFRVDAGEWDPSIGFGSYPERMLG